ncbi:hypothetical protein [Vitiosangium sp. GDMCC 1.1324]|uniref:hypothetical protein n=1 Tax=Vitiosangium sp. (strain GDMCC 1.1324) TaxID=2138576 RepID=UPI000D33555B|nr:hypothetical protein [Vitiosangium sp. GDMCC 1.1324]PTL81567.1 hypothetical protein DAT35_21645 [Vitiosangium sp. GDMCC 1.1324]
MDSSFAESSADDTDQAAETPRWLPWLWSGLVLAGSVTYAIASWTEDRNQGVRTILDWWCAVLGL